jgi:SAM-dependent methyltransferase
VFEKFLSTKTNRNIAIIGLGTGTTAAYGKAGDTFTYYEIDKIIRDIARNPKYFTYLTDAEERGVTIKIIMGDARVQMERVRKQNQERDEQHEPKILYDLIVVDAFSSDAIPIHLITRQALQLYLDLLAPDGVIAFHISNRYLDLEYVLANLEKKLGLVGIMQSDSSEKEVGKAASSWVLLTPPKQARSTGAALLPWQRDDVIALAALGPLLGPLNMLPFAAFTPQEIFYSSVVWQYFGNLTDDIQRHVRGHGRWQPLWWEREPKVGVWTDDYSNLFSVFRRRKSSSDE